VESDAYRDVLERSRPPRLARSLFCSALVDEAAGLPESAGWRFLEAAWACDDKNAREPASTCRQRAAEMFRRALVSGEAEAPHALVLTVMADLWRRAGRFDDAIEAAAEAEALLTEADEDDRPTALVAAFIRALADADDDALHSTAEVFSSDA
jgi:hypothetical protein